MGAALAVRHVLEGADDLDGAKECRKSFSGPAQVFSIPAVDDREARRAAFVAVLGDRRRRGALTEVAKAWGTCLAKVKRVRDGLSPMRDDHIAKLPGSLRAAFDAALAAPIQLRLPLL